MTTTTKRYYVRASVAEAVMDRVTYVTRQGGTSLGRIHNGIVFRSGGNGRYYSVDADQIAEIHHDDGAGYLKAVEDLTGWKLFCRTP